MFWTGCWTFDWTASRTRSSFAKRYLSLIVLLTGSCLPLEAESAALPEYFGVYLKQGERLSRLEPLKKDASGIRGSHELNDIKPIVAGEEDVQFLIYMGGATDLIEIPVVRLERVAREIDAKTGALRPLKNIWYIHPSERSMRVAPIAERPGLLVRSDVSHAIPSGYWAIEIRDAYFPFAAGRQPERAAGCLQRGRLGGYEPCQPAAPPLSGTTVPAANRASNPASTIWGFGRGLSRDIWENALVRSTVGLGLLLILYACFYWFRLFLTRSYFLEVAPFRVWGDAAPKYVAEGLAACVVDELQRLQKDIREHGTFQGSKSSDLEFHNVSEIPTTAQVTIEFKGMSPEALHAFLKRASGRRTLITGDLIPKGDSLRLLGRSAGMPWEVETANSYDALPYALREFAVYAVVAVRSPIQRALANALAYKQAEAFARNDDEEALRLARLGVIVMPDQAVQLFNRGVAHQRLGNLDEAIEDYSAAIQRDDKLASAYINRAVIYASRGELEEAESDLTDAQRLDPNNEKLGPALEKVRKANAAQMGDEELQAPPRDENSS